MRKDGRFEVKGYDASGKRVSYYGRTKAEAEAARAAATIQEATPTAPGSTYFDFYLTAYLPSRCHCTQAWRAQIAWAHDGYILPAFGAMPIEAITRRDLQAWINGLKLEPSSVAKVRIVLSGVLNLAVADEVIARNPAEKLRLPTPPPSNRRSLSPHELNHLLRHAQGPVRSAIILGACGLRLGEVCGAALDDLDGDVLIVRRQVLQPAGGGRITDTLKTPQSNRRVPLPLWVADELRSRAKAHLVAPIRRSRFLFSLPNNVSRDFAAVVQKAGLQPLTFHELRHTFISLLENEVGAPRPIVEELSGKAKGGGLGVYSRSREDVRAEWMARYWQLVQESHGLKAVDGLRVV